MLLRAVLRSPRRSSRLRLDTRHTRLAVEPLEDRRLLAVMSFQDGVLPTPDYAGTRDVPLFGAEEDVNFGDEVTLRADAEQGSTGFPIWSLVKWDLSGIPATATINDVSITVNVSNTTVAAIDIRDLIIDDYIASYDSQTETYGVKSVFLIGHVPIPMSGSNSPDGHGKRPMPADLFYGEVDGSIATRDLTSCSRAGNVRVVFKRTRTP